MSNSYNASSILADPSGTVAGKDIIFTTPDRMAQSINYSFAAGGCHNVLSQAYADTVFVQDSTSFVEMSQWRIPLVSLEHTELEIVINYKLDGVSTACNAKLNLQIGASSSSVTINLPTSTNNIVNDSINITMPASNEYYGTLTIEIQADSTTAEVQVFSLMAAWKRINSPISAGQKNQYLTTEKFRPFGTVRTNADNALTSRFAHNMIDDIAILRTRYKSYLTWSGVYAPSSSSSLTDAAASAVYLGTGHIDNLVGFPMLPNGWEELTGNKLELHVRAIGDVTFDFMGNEIVIDQATSFTVGWSIFTLEIDNADLSDIGDLNLPYYQATVDNTSQNYGNLAGYLPTPFTTRFPVVNSGNSGAILSITLMGV